MTLLSQLALICMPFVSGVAGYLVYRYVEKVDQSIDKLEVRILELKADVDKINISNRSIGIGIDQVKAIMPNSISQHQDLKLDIMEVKSSVGYLRSEIEAVVKDNAKFKVAYGKIIRILGTISKPN